MASGEAERRLAVLIDGENANPGHLEDLMVEIAGHGEAIIRRVYGPWESPRMNAWSNVIHFHAFRPMQQSRYVTGKNAADIALIIDAMDLLYTTNVDGFCIVSSDSDYTPLVIHLREKGKYVLGIGDQKTPEALKRACTAFRTTEVIARRPPPPEPRVTAKAAKGARPRDGGRERERERDREPAGGVPARVVDMLARAADAVQQEDGYARLREVGNQVRRMDPSFDHRNFGVSKLVQLVERAGAFDVETRGNEVYVRKA